MDSELLNTGGIIFLVACPIVTVLFIVWARVFFRRSGAGSAEQTARAYLDALQAQNFRRAAELVSVSVLRDDAQRHAWVTRMEATQDRKRLVRYTLGKPRVNASHDPNPGQIEFTVEAAEQMRDKEYPATLGLRLAIDRQSGQHRIVYSPEIYEETQTRLVRR
jgi:hypothetical protein